MKKIILGELFCGPGGIAMGAELANKSISSLTDFEFEHGWAVDYEAVDNSEDDTEEEEIAPFALNSKEEL